MTGNNAKRIAVLIDAENVSHEYIEDILDEISVLPGVPTYKRIYGNFLSKQMKGWNEIANKYSLNQVQQQNYTKGKNSSDAVLVIDAMDILYSNLVDGICIASSDSDFTRLASRIRESGLDVIGMGEEKTAESFINACTVFKYLGIGESEAEPEVEVEEDGAGETLEPSGPLGFPSRTGRLPAESEGAEEKVPRGRNGGGNGGGAGGGKCINAPKKVIATIKTAIDENADDDGWTHIGPVGSALKSRYPDFDARRYGCNSKQLSAFFMRLEEFEVIARGADPKKAYYIRIKEER